MEGDSEKDEKYALRSRTGIFLLGTAYLVKGGKRIALFESKKRKASE